MNAVENVAAGLDTFARDCSVTVALKIADDSCKMDDEQRALFMSLYDALPPYSSEIFDENIHTLIHEARTQPTAMVFSKVKKERERAMVIITQERMKAFKSSFRALLVLAKLTQ